MPIIIERDELKALLEDVAKVAVAAYIRETTPAQDKISQNQAYKMFGEAQVKRWVEDRRIRPIRIGDHRNSTRYYSLAELRTQEAVEKNLFSINRPRKAI